MKFVRTFHPVNKQTGTGNRLPRTETIEFNQGENEGLWKLWSVTWLPYDRITTGPDGTRYYGGCYAIWLVEGAPVAAGVVQRAKRRKFFS